jgi:hypothetical protein
MWENSQIDKRNYHQEQEPHFSPTDLIEILIFSRQNDMKRGFLFIFIFSHFLGIQAETLRKKKNLCCGIIDFSCNFFVRFTRDFITPLAYLSHTGLHPSKPLLLPKTISITTKNEKDLRLEIKFKNHFYQSNPKRK